MDYLGRCSYMLQQGLSVADACYYYGDQAPNFYPAFHVVPEKILLESLGEGYDYDVVNSDVILNRISVKDGRIVLPDGLSFSLLVLPDQNQFPLDVLQKLDQMIKDGATVIGRKPTEIPYLNNHSVDKIELSELADRMWGSNDSQGKVVATRTAREVLLARGIGPDFSHDLPSTLDYIHRKTGETDMYFVRNTSGEFYSGNCSFRITDKYPELWDPSTGKQVLVEKFTDKDGRINIKLDLDANASAFVVFTKNKRSISTSSEQTFVAEKITSINGKWKVTFPEGWGAPNEASFKKLMSWTESDNKGIQYFSGTAGYHKTITIQAEDLKKNTSVEISLGKVCDVAEIYLNGKSAGILWKKPFKIDITDLVKAGENELKIEIVNQWVNRLTGDMLSEQEERFCRTNQPYVTSDDFGYDNWIEDSDETFSLKTSGLLGPVHILYGKK